MKKLITLVLMIGLLLPTHSSFALSTDVVLCEVQTESLTSASEEYIQLCNNSPSSVDVTDWHVQYFSSGVSAFATPSRNIALTGFIEAGGTYGIASNGYKTDVARSFYGATLAATGGHIRLTKGTGASEATVDLIGWGSALLPETTAADLVVKGQSYKRRTENNLYVDTDNNKTDFATPVVQQPIPGPTSLQGTPTSYAYIEISELLPDPASPVLDADGEFVELFNPNKGTINLEGYIVETGSTYAYSYTIHAMSINEGEYIALFAPQTGLTLSNTEGRARLKDPTGAVVFETDPYAKAVTGSSWSYVDGAWVWTSVLTPRAANIAATPATSASTATSQKAKKSSTSKPKSAVKSASTKNSNTKTEPLANYNKPASDNKALPINPLVLAGVGVAALGYMIYEYRQDIENFFSKLKRNRAYRKRTSGQS